MSLPETSLQKKNIASHEKYGIHMYKYLFACCAFQPTEIRTPNKLSKVILITGNTCIAQVKIDLQ